MVRYVYGVEKFDDKCLVHRFKADEGDRAVRWLLRASEFDTTRVLCSLEEAKAMAGEQATQRRNLIVWEG